MVRVYRKDYLEGYEVSEEEAIELEKVGYTRNFAEAKAASLVSEPQFSQQEGYEVGQALFSFLPESVLNEFAKQWAKSGNSEIAIGATRNTKTWKDEFGYLQRDDGSLIMDELSALSTISTYKQTLGEVGIQDFTDFEDEFQSLISIDVLEHIPEDDIDEIFKYWYHRNMKYVFATIAAYPARATLSDGTNAHVNLNDKAWWMSKIKKHITCHTEIIYMPTNSRKERVVFKNNS